MSNVLRFKIIVTTLGEGWEVTVKCEDLNFVSEPRQIKKLPQMKDKKGNTFPLPPDGEALSVWALPDPTAAPKDQEESTFSLFEKTLNSIDRRRPEEANIRKYGRYLFDTLIGETVWTQMKNLIEDGDKKYIELALQWEEGENDFHRLHWEMMAYPENKFLVEQFPFPVTVTRVVAGETSEEEYPDRFSLPVRILFVIGTSLNDPQIRPGAELMGLLRQLEGEAHKVYTRIVQDATPEKVQQAVANFHPNVVYLIAHGRLDRERGPLVELALEEAEKGNLALKYRTGTDLLKLLRDGDRYPPIVVLSVCHTADVGDGNKTKMMNGAEAAPLAAQLVSGGVPIVVGMSGQVSDLACRLFTRRFGEAIVLGQPIVRATAEARWAAFSQGIPTKNWVDWGFPTLFLDSRVNAGFTPLNIEDTGKPNEFEKIRDWLGKLQLSRKTPVFCGRYKFFEDLQRMLPYKTSNDEWRQPTRSVLAIQVNNNDPGFGRERLLVEMAAQAVRQGHIPILINPIPKVEDPPSSVYEFGVKIYHLCLNIRKYYEILETMWTDEGGFNSQMYYLMQINEKKISKNEALKHFDISIKTKLLSLEETDPEVVKEAIDLDLQTLLEDASKKHPDLIDKVNSRVLILLNRVHDYGQIVPNLLGGTKSLLSENGLGINRPVPVVLIYSKVGNHDPNNPSDQNIKNLDTYPADWFMRRTLGPFNKGEDNLAYKTVWLNPYGKLEKPLTIKEDLKPGEEKLLNLLLETNLKGLPGVFDKDNGAFFSMAETLVENDFLKPAEDDQVLSKMLNDWGWQQ